MSTISFKLINDFKLCRPKQLCYITHDMEKVQTKIPPEVRKYLTHLAKMGGAAKSKRKALSSRKNGSAPCRPGKFRGRPPKLKE